MCAGSHGQTARHISRGVIPVISGRSTPTLTKDGWFCFCWDCPHCKEENSGSGYREDAAEHFCQCNCCGGKVIVIGI